MVKFNYTLILQIISILAGIFGVVAGVIRCFSGGFGGFINGIITILFALFCLICEIYIFSFFRYFGFMFKNWGKGCMYLFMGALLFATSGFGLVCAIIFWALAIVYFVLAFFAKAVSPPVLQGGWKSGSPPSMNIDASEIYEMNQKQMDDVSKVGKSKKESKTDEV
ncbi:hypothetical protein TRFO_01318 [Tritrichomonas foetus]|uniref:COPI associated protein n=1 Tax=Tritrichomonas foetus TaxID=1144522 RepID=A0A1J4KBY3_9EUKA|nr:hypothetical protein TRFO_01318 [Tritrichomonas foetus]|eukprot:OHT07182.1 hypothetical protein TRFO_01318 [Tritrichomonas foetus]